MKLFFKISAISLVAAVIVAAALEYAATENRTPPQANTARAVVSADTQPSGHANGTQEEKEGMKHSAAARRRIQENAQKNSAASRERTLLKVVDQEDITPHHRMLADETLRAIHHECRTHLENFYVRYDDPDLRGLGGGGTMIISGLVSDDEFRALIIHECGHVIDTGSWQGTMHAGSTSFSDGDHAIYANDPSLGYYIISWQKPDKMKQGINPGDFVSGYAASNAFEDFAESFAYFTLHREEFLSRAQSNPVLMKKYVWLLQHIQPHVPAISQNVWDGAMPWDITKLAYQWIGADRQQTAVLVVPPLSSSSR